MSPKENKAFITLMHSQKFGYHCHFKHSPTASGPDSADDLIILLSYDLLHLLQHHCQHS